MSRAPGERTKHQSSSLTRALGYEPQEGRLSRGQGARNGHCLLSVLCKDPGRKTFIAGRVLELQEWVGRECMEQASGVNQSPGEVYGKHEAKNHPWIVLKESRVGLASRKQHG